MPRQQAPQGFGAPPSDPQHKTHRLARQSLLWTILGVLSAAGIGIYAIVEGQNTAEGSETSDHGTEAAAEFGEPLYESELALEHTGYGQAHDGTQRCKFGGYDFDVDDEPSYSAVVDDNDFDNEVDVQYALCLDEADDGNVYNVFAMKLRSSTEGRLENFNAVSSPDDCFTTAKAGGQDDERNRQWWIAQTENGYFKPDPDTFCLLTPDNLVRIQFKDYTPRGDVSTAEVNVTVWAQP